MWFHTHQFFTKPNGTPHYQFSSKDSRFFFFDSTFAIIGHARDFMWVSLGVFDCETEQCFFFFKNELKP